MGLTVNRLAFSLTPNSTMETSGAKRKIEQDSENVAFEKQSKNQDQNQLKFRMSGAGRPVLDTEMEDNLVFLKGRCF